VFGELLGGGGQDAPLRVLRVPHHGASLQPTSQLTSSPAAL
jgi:hypothetical protein